MVQEIARADDQPAAIAEHLIDEAVFGDHPLGRPVLGPAEHIRDTFTRDGIVAFRTRRWSPSAGRRVRGRQPRGARRQRRARRAVRALPARPGARALRPRPAAGRRASSCASATPTSRTCGCPTGRGRRSTIPSSAPRCDLLDAARRLDGVAPVRRDPRAARAGLLGLGLPPRLRRRPGAPAVRRAWSPASASRPTGGCGRSSPSCATTARPRPRSSAPRPTPPARGRSRSRTPARWPATPPSRRSSTARTSTPTPTIELLDEVTFDEVREVAAGVADELSVAVVGPHTVEELETA